MKIVYAFVLCALGGLSLSFMGCDVATGISPSLQSGDLVAQIDQIGPANLSDGFLTKMNPVSGGPDSRWTQYISAVSLHCGGDDPAGLAFEAVTLALGDGSSLKNLEDVFSGSVSVQIKDDDTGQRVSIATRASVAGSEAVALNVTGNRATLAPLLGGLTAGRFSVGFVGATSLTTEFDVSLKVGVRLRGYCPETPSP